ncbi:nitrous oxide-stimulated promoter family protein [Candidatus Saganbacteria bacterium]|nr:nitrous oxide-stimulated promoter family protein [Candidatus Saganbacteria bacterium]
MKTKDAEAKTLTRFIEIYCREKHHVLALCPACADLLSYAGKRLKACPYDPKPKCKNCLTHCYLPAYRDKIRAVMKFSGMYMIKRGRLDWLFHYFLGKG